MTAYDERRAAHVQAWGAALPDRLERLTWDRARIDAHRAAALAELLRRARESSPWHRERLRDVDLDAVGPADLSALPTMTKRDLMASYDDITTDPRVTLAAAEAHVGSLHDDAYFQDDLHVVASGGSSGERGVYVYGWDAWVDVHLGLSRWVIADAFAHPGPPGEPLLMGLVAASNATHMTTSVSRTFASPMVAVSSFPVALPVSEIVTGLNDAQPAILGTYSSMLAVLADEAVAGRLRISPRRIIGTSEPLLPEVRAAAQEAFGAPVANCWGTSEGGVMAVGCWQSEGMHVNEDLVILEPVDDAGRPVPPGERAAKVLLTNLYNPVLPLLRYELTDEVTVLDEPCPCGSAHVRVADVQGRADDVLRFGSRTVHPHVVRSVLGQHRELVEYQVHQRPRGLEVLVTRRPEAPELIVKQLEEALARAGLPAPDVTVEVVERLRRHESTGKLARFVALPS